MDAAASEVVGSAQQFLGMSPATFLRDYWQRRPLLVRSAFPQFDAPLDGNDLAALALNPEALARLVRHRRRSDRWQVNHGPFEESDFTQLPARDWTLLVQDVDKWDPEVAELLNHFDFLPRWRIDDIMVSFAAPGGSVGPHVDQYDVFLLQGSGHRHWAIDCSNSPELSHREDSPLRLLRQFEPTHQWQLAPGDMLYLPPGIPHHGVATDPCLTLSIGMRAPAIAELLAPLLEEFAARLGEGRRFEDAGRLPATDSAHLDDVDIDRFRAQIGAALAELQQLPQADLADFCARFLSQYRQAREPERRLRKLSAEALGRTLERGAALRLSCGLRYLRRPNDQSFYVCGQAWPLPKALADDLVGCGIGSAAWRRAAPQARNLLAQMFAEGIVERRPAHSGSSPQR